MSTSNFAGVKDCSALYAYIPESNEEYFEDSEEIFEAIKAEINDKTSFIILQSSETRFAFTNIGYYKDGGWHNLRVALTAENGYYEGFQVDAEIDTEEEYCTKKAYKEAKRLIAQAEKIYAKYCTRL